MLICFVAGLLSLLDAIALSQRRLYSMQRDFLVFAQLRFLWNATRGHRLAPWRSAYMRWRVETYSGMPAETLTPRKIFAFVWDSKWELLSFLVWTRRLEREVRSRT